MHTVKIFVKAKLLSNLSNPSLNKVWLLRPILFLRIIFYPSYRHFILIISPLKENLAYATNNFLTYTVLNADVWFFLYFNLRLVTHASKWYYFIYLISNSCKYWLHFMFSIFFWRNLMLEIIYFLSNCCCKNEFNISIDIHVIDAMYKNRLNRSNPST